MKQYCRYCSSCCEIDEGFYCSIKEMVMGRKQIHSETNCCEYTYCELGDVETGRQYKPRKNKTNDGQQISLIEKGGENGK